jgi:hypothetical protein
MRARMPTIMPAMSEEAVYEFIVQASARPQNVVMLKIKD